MKNLLPCPFCGRKPPYVEMVEVFSAGKAPRWQVWCSSGCDARSTVCGSPGEAAAFWNARPAPPPPPQPSLGVWKKYDSESCRPDDERWVLVFLNGNLDQLPDDAPRDTRLGYFDLDENAWRVDHSLRRGKLVTHWMDLPDAPETTP